MGVCGLPGIEFVMCKSLWCAGFVLCKAFGFVVCRVCAVFNGCDFQISSADALGAGLFFFQGIARWHLSNSQSALAQCKLSMHFRVLIYASKP